MQDERMSVAGAWRPAMVAWLMLWSGVVPAAALEVQVVDLDPAARGRVNVRLYDGPDGWAAPQSPVALRREHGGGRTTLVLRFEDLPPGRYAAMVLHDLDGNGRFDTGLFGIPSDGYGFSNNPRVLRRPSFETVAFELPAQGTRITVRMR